MYPKIIEIGQDIRQLWSKYILPLYMYPNQSVLFSVFYHAFNVMWAIFSGCLKHSFTMKRCKNY